MTDAITIEMPDNHFVPGAKVAITYEPERGALLLTQRLPNGDATRLVVAAEDLLEGVTDAVLGVPIRLADVLLVTKEGADGRWGGVRTSADLAAELPSIIKTVHAELGWARAALVAQEEVDPAEISTREALRQIPHLRSEPDLINAIIAAGLRVPTTAVVES